MNVSVFFWLILLHFILKFLKSILCSKLAISCCYSYSITLSIHLIKKTHTYPYRFNIQGLLFTHSELLCLLCCFEVLELYQGSRMTHSSVNCLPQWSLFFLHPSISLYCLSFISASLMVSFYYFLLLLLSPSAFPEVLWFPPICKHCSCNFLLEGKGNRCNSSVCYLERVDRMRTA